MRARSTSTVDKLGSSPWMARSFKTAEAYRKLSTSAGSGVIPDVPSTLRVGRRVATGLQKRLKLRPKLTQCLTAVTDLVLLLNG